MQSHLRLFNGELTERLGPTLLHFRLSTRGGQVWPAIMPLANARKYFSRFAPCA